MNYETFQRAHSAIQRTPRDMRPVPQDVVKSWLQTAAIMLGLNDAFNVIRDTMFKNGKFRVPKPWEFGKWRKLGKALIDVVEKIVGLWRKDKPSRKVAYDVYQDENVDVA